MCTSFVIHADQTIIGMNFDISQRPIKLALIDEQFIIFQKYEGRFLPAFGCTKSGIFMNLLSVAPNEAGSYRRGKNCVHMMKLFSDVLAEKVELSNLQKYLDETKIVNVPNYSVHSMITGNNQKTFIVEPGRPLIERTKKVAVLTNFTFSTLLDADYKNVKGTGSERYKRAYEEISKNEDSFSLESGFKVLQQTAQYEGDFPTQLSIIYIPDEETVYFTVRRDFKKVFSFSFLTKQIEGKIGFQTNHVFKLSKKGVLLSELEQQNGVSTT